VSDILDFVEPISDFSFKSAPFMIEAFAWYLHEVKERERVSTGDLAICFEKAHIPKPANIAASLAKLCGRKPARFIRDSKGYRLSVHARKELGELLPVRATAVKATRVLTELLVRVAEPTQKAFLQETLVCFNHHAYRAAIVMIWNLVFSDVLDRIFMNHLQLFNSQVGTHGFKNVIQKRSDFAEMKESQVIALARAAKILSKESMKVLDEKLNKRNTAAHPSTVVVGVTTAEEVIFDLVENILLKPVL
jgi:hypothetical protein